MTSVVKVAAFAGELGIADGPCVVVDVAGTVKFQMLDDSFDTWVVNAGSQYAIVYKVIHTDSTATGIHALS